jgi:DNA end-binding protein Ku
VDIGEFNLPTSDLREFGVAKKEIDLATQLIDGMTVKWSPSKFHDEYREVLMKLVQKKVNAGQTEAIENPEQDEAPVRQTLNFMDVLKRSVEHTKSRAATTRARKPKTASRTRRPRKKRAG